MPDPRLAPLLAYATAGGRVCPLPVLWDRMWSLMDHRGPTPAILGAWHVEADVKRSVLEKQIRVAAEQGFLPAVDQFLRRLEVEDWFYLSHTWKRRAFQREYRALLRYVRAAGRVCPLPDSWVRITGLVAAENLVLGGPSVGQSALKGFDGSEGEWLQWTSGALGMRVDEQMAVCPCPPARRRYAAARSYR